MFSSFRRMRRHFNGFWNRVFFKPCDRIRLSSEEKKAFLELSKNYSIIYVLKQPSLLEFNFFNALFIKEGLPLAGWAPQIRLWLLWWLPFKEFCRGVLEWLQELVYIYQHSETAITTALLQQIESVERAGDPLLLALTPHYRKRRWRHDRSSSDYLELVFKAAARRNDPIAFVPLHYVYDYRPDKTPSRWVAFLSDYRFRHSTILKFLSFLWGSRRMGSLKLGEAIIHAPSPTASHLLMEQQLTHAFKQEHLRLAGPDLATPREIYRDLLLSPDYQRGLAAFAAASDKAEHIFYEIAADMHPSYIEGYDIILRKVFSKLYRSVIIDERDMQRLKQLAGNATHDDATIVLAPNHRSHTDYLLLSYLFYEHHLTPPHICGGINLNFWPVGHFLRRGGCFFIHRHIDDRSLYAFVLKSYLGELIRHGHSIEFFIEGSRSRNGKLLRPKLGFLSMLRDAARAHPTRPLYIVPVSITYDKVLEEKSYSEEAVGKSKKKESAKDLLHLRHFLQANYGHVHIHFGDAIAGSDFFKIGDKQSIPALAEKISHSINQQLVATASSLVAMAFLESPHTALSYDDLWQRFSLFVDYLNYRKRPLSGALERHPQSACDEALELLMHARLVQLTHDGEERVYTLHRDKRTVMDYYKNNSVHFFVSLACIATALLAHPDPRMPFNVLVDQFDVIKKTLRFEFTFSTRLSSEAHARELLQYMVKRGWMTHDNDDIAFTATAEPMLSWFAHLLRPFFEAYWLATAGLSRKPFSRTHRNALVKSLLELGQIKYNRGQLRYSESLNRWTLQNALDHLRAAGLLMTHEQSEGKKGREFYSTVHAAHAFAAHQAELKRYLRD